ncbi:MAG: OmpA family protein [Nitrospirota bacterium]|nr:OmpA family protein [Nitrospirota bacterium]
MRSVTFSRIALTAMLAAGTGCAASTQLTREQVLEQYTQVAALEQRMGQAREHEMDLFAQATFAQATQAQSRAEKLARKGNPDADRIASDGLNALDEAAQVTTRAQDVFEEVLVARNRALKAGASRTNEAFIDAERDLAKATSVLERGDLESAKEARPELIQAYQDIELVVVKAGTIGMARQAIADAERAGARKHAPKTLAMAEQEMALALSVLDANRDDRAKADQNAVTAAYLAARATQIVDLAQQFERRDYTTEDMILWYQGQLETVAQPLGTPLAFNHEDKRVVRALRDEIAALSSRAEGLQGELIAARAEVERTQADAAQRMTASERAAQAARLETERRTQAQLTAEAQRKDAEMAAMEARLKGELGTVEAQRAADQQRQAEAQRRLDLVQSLFTEPEAEVLRKRDDILIRSHGFYFPVGQSEIDSRNFALLNKIVTAINAFPGSTVEISGHTDVTGSGKVNQQLSTERADKVARFLTEVGKIDADRIRSEGFGPDRPIAPNTTPEGRTANRRVEVLIHPGN